MGCVSSRPPKDGEMDGIGKVGGVPGDTFTACGPVHLPPPDLHILSQPLGASQIDATGKAADHSSPADSDGAPWAITMPLQPHQARQLIEACKHSTRYGSKEGAEVAEKISQQSKELMPHEFSLSRDWSEGVTRFLEDAKQRLGMPEKQSVQAELQKLLLYEEGDQFSFLTGSLKQPDSFVTLIFQLPSAYKGGAFIVRPIIKHIVDGEIKGFENRDADEVRYELCKGSGDGVKFTALYSACEHSMEPIESGYRLALVYSVFKPPVDRTGIPDCPIVEGSREGNKTEHPKELERKHSKGTRTKRPARRVDIALG